VGGLSHIEEAAVEMLGCALVVRSPVSDQAIAMERHQHQAGDEQTSLELATAALVRRAHVNPKPSRPERGGPPWAMRFPWHH
jgi:hypothetical protein